MSTTAAFPFTTTRLGELRLPWGRATTYPRIDIAQRLIRRMPPYPWRQTDDDLAAALRVSREFARGLIAGLVHAGAVRVEPDGSYSRTLDADLPALEPTEDTIGDGWPA